TDYDLRGHARESGRDLSVMDEGKVLPHVFELSMGIDRTIYSIMEHGLTREKERLVLKVPLYLAPIQVAVFPLVNRNRLPEEAKKIHEMLRKSFDVFYDDSGSIGRRYRRQDEVGTPCCVTVDYQTTEDETVTVRDRDTMLQKRTGVDALFGHIREKVSFPSG
ncbi:MAG: His/Gly/Thr/Pro-type tRNA ligase C-terminal domain-containing protein, partial [Aigarchaeota archaeon]|nr:His/Gly/Thr/Pro-type tRNA ligase C-terminal domain-containing protein [Aigarchaeota archaeon]